MLDVECSMFLVSDAYGSGSGVGTAVRDRDQDLGDVQFSGAFASASV